MATVTANNTRLTAADAATGFSNLPAGGAGPAAEPQLRYQGTNAANKKITTTASRTGLAYTHGSTTDMTATANRLWLAKVVVGDFGDLNATYGVSLAIGNDISNYYDYNISGSGANNDWYTGGYNSQGGRAGGYLIVALNPNVSGWREGTTGSPVLTTVDYFGVLAQFVVGGAKSENMAIDAIDIGTGLTYTGTVFTFEDGVTEDQGNTSNRWGYACSVGDAIFLRGKHTLGTASSLTGTDNSVVFFPDGYHQQGDFAIVVDLQNASTDVVLAGVYQGLGRSYSGITDTRPDLTVSGTSGDLELAGLFGNFRNMAFTSGVIVTGDIEASDISQGSAVLSGAVVRTTSAVATVTIDDPTWSSLVGTEFVQAGAGHAVEVAGTSTITIDGTSFTGYGDDGQTDAALYFSSSSGSITVNLTSGTAQPTYRSAGVTVTFVSSTTLTLTGLADNTQVVIRRVSDDSELYADSDVGVDGSTAYSYAAGLIGVSVSVVVVSLNEEPFNLTLSLPSADTSIPLAQTNDRVYDNP